MSAKEQVLADAIKCAIKANAVIIKQRRLIVCLLIIIAGLIGGYFFI